MRKLQEKRYQIFYFVPKKIKMANQANFSTLHWSITYIKRIATFIIIIKSNAVYVWHKNNIKRKPAFLEELYTPVVPIVVF
jgi:hypothetical protein